MNKKNHLALNYSVQFWILICVLVMSKFNSKKINRNKLCVEYIMFSTSSLILWHH